MMRDSRLLLCGSMGERESLSCGVFEEDVSVDKKGCLLSFFSHLFASFVRLFFQTSSPLKVWDASLSSRLASYSGATFFGAKDAFTSGNPFENEALVARGFSLNGWCWGAAQVRPSCSFLMNPVP